MLNPNKPYYFQLTVFISAFSSSSISSSSLIFPLLPPLSEITHPTTSLKYNFLHFVCPLILTFRGLILPLMGSRQFRSPTLSSRWHNSSRFRRQIEKPPLVVRSMWRITEAGTNRSADRGSDGLTLPVFHENVGRQQTLKSKPFLTLGALPVSVSMTSEFKVRVSNMDRAAWTLWAPLRLILKLLSSDTDFVLSLYQILASIFKISRKCNQKLAG